VALAARRDLRHVAARERSRHGKRNGEDAMFYGHIEGTGVTVLDPRFKNLYAGYARVEHHWSGARWSEGTA